jgi:hypothetical protein
MNTPDSGGVAYLLVALILALTLGPARRAAALSATPRLRRTRLAVLAATAAIMSFIVYTAPSTAGVFGTAIMVSVFGDSHALAWSIETLGVPAAFEGGRELLRRRGPARYLAEVVIATFIRCGFAAAILLLSCGMYSWEHWLGLGLLVGALMRAIFDAAAIRRGWSAVRAGRTPGGSADRPTNRSNSAPTARVAW